MEYNVEQMGWEGIGITFILMGLYIAIKIYLYKNEYKNED